MARFPSRPLLETIATAAIAAACVATAPASTRPPAASTTAGPTASTTATSAGPAPSTMPPSPATTRATGSRPPASALPSNPVPCDPSSRPFVVSLHAVHGIVDAPGTAAPELPASPAGSAASATPGTVADAGELVGERSYTVDFALNLGTDRQPVAPAAVQASVSMAGAALPVPVDLRQTSAAIILPDGTGPATLIVVARIAARPCPDLLATARFKFRLVPAATAAACPADEQGYARLIEGLAPRLTFAGVTRAFAIETFLARYVDIAAADQVPPFAGFDPATPAATADRGRPVEIRSAAPGVALTGGIVQTWRRADVVGPDGKVRQAAGAPIAEEQVQAADGVNAWTAPSAPGDYVIGLLPTWSQACMTGSGSLFVSLTVR